MVLLAAALTVELRADQDTRLDSLSSSIGRQHHLSININDELDVHQGLLSDLDDGLDRVGSRLSTARRSLDRVSRGVKGNGAPHFLLPT